MLAEVVTAIATVAAVIISLVLALRPRWLNFLWRPKLKPSLGEPSRREGLNEPYCIKLRVGKEKSIDDVLFRLKICNQGRSEAKSVWVRMKEYSYADPEDGPDLNPKSAPYKKLIQEINEPVNLRWSGFEEKIREVKIPAKSELFVELFEYKITENDKENELVFRTTETIISKPNPLMAMHKDVNKRRHLILVTFGAEDVTPQTKAVEVILNARHDNDNKNPHHIDSFKLVEIPKPSDYKSG